ncbi:MAG: DALR domain-containing protein, partial [Dehalococcoidia bacterium]
HNGLMRLPESEEKMTRHLGNLVPIGQAVQSYGSDAVRLFVLSSHYRSPLTYSNEGMEAAKRGAERLRIAANLQGGDTGTTVESEPLRQRFLEVMDDDLNTAAALAALFDLAREINRGRDEGSRIEGAQATLRELAAILGLTLEETEAGLAAQPFIDLLVELRNDLRANKLYDLADRLRARLAELGIALEDEDEGTRWRRRE